MQHTRFRTLGRIVPVALAVALVAGAAAAAVAAPGRPYTVGFSTIYLTPTWMQETTQMLQQEFDKLKARGLVDRLVIANANGSTSQQFAQIQSMVDQGVDIILVTAGSSTGLNPAIARAHAQGVAVVNFDSLVTTDQLTARIAPDQVEFGRVLAQWLVDKLGGKGRIIAINGPAGVSVSNDRWRGAEEVFKKHPGIQIVQVLHSEYNEAPAEMAMSAALAANPNIDGVFSQGGSLSAGAVSAMLKAGRKLVPVTGENYNHFLQLWYEHRKDGFSSIATAQPNWLIVLALHAGLRKLEGCQVSKDPTIPLPIITDDNLGDFVPNDYPEGWYPIKPLTQAEIDKILGPCDKY